MARRFLVACVVWLGLFAGAARAQILELTTAAAHITVDGQSTEQTVVLPYHWDRLHPGRSGEAEFEFSFEMALQPSEPYGLYVARLGNAYEIWLNGAIVAHQGDLTLPNSADYAKAPRYILLSPGLLTAHNRLQVRIRADVARRGGLAPLVLGPEDLIYPRYLEDYQLRVTGSLVVLVLGVLVGLACLSLWWTQTKLHRDGRHSRDRVYLLASIAEFAWTVSVGDALIESPWIPWPWWGSVPLLTTSVWTCSMTLLCAELAGWRHARPMRWLAAWLVFLIVACQAAAILSRFGGQPLALKLMYLLSGLSAFVFAAYFIARAFRGASLEHRMMALALGVNTLTGLRDIFVFEIQRRYGESSLLRYSALLFGLTLGVVVMLRLRRVSFQAHALTQELKHRVSQKERELAQNYARAEQLAREQARSSERSRLLQDVHDGLGAHLSSAIRQTESGLASKAQLLSTLHATLDELKLSMDTVGMQAGDVNALLASLRYRLEPRLQGAGLKFLWEVAPLPTVPGLDAMGMRQLQFMLLEAVSNALQHARATVLRVLAMTTQTHVSIHVVDDGRGFDPTLTGQRGLAGLQARAQALGARCAINSGPEGTCVQIELPLKRGGGEESRLYDSRTDDDRVLHP